MEISKQTRVVELATSIRKHLDNIGGEFSYIGDALAEAKELLGPNFPAWIREEFNWNEQLANKFITYRGNANKRVVAEALIISNPEMSNRAIAKKAGLGRGTVNNVRAESRGQIGHVTERIGGDGKIYHIRPRPALPPAKEERWPHGAPFAGSRQILYTMQIGDEIKGCAAAINKFVSRYIDQDIDVTERDLIKGRIAKLRASISRLEKWLNPGAKPKLIEGE